MERSAEPTKEHTAVDVELSTLVQVGVICIVFGRIPEPSTNQPGDASLEPRHLIPIVPAVLNTKMFYQNMPFPLSHYSVLSYTEVLFRLLKQAFLQSPPVLSKSELPHINTGGLTLLQGLFNSQLLQQECPEQPNADTLKR